MTNTKLPKILVIVGPTTSHKTHLAVEIANRFDGEIINADAYQVYSDMSIGTNAPTKNELKSAKFHLNQFIKFLIIILIISFISFSRRQIIVFDYCINI